MGVDWEFLRTVVHKPDEWSKDELEEVYQNVSGVSQLKQRDKTLEKVQLLFHLSQAVMKSKWEQVKYLEAEMQELAESAGHLDARREEELLLEIDNLTQLLHSKDSTHKDLHLPYDWTQELKAKNRKLEEGLITKQDEIEQLIREREVSEETKRQLESEVLDLQTELERSTHNIDRLTVDLEEIKDLLSASRGHLAEAEEKILCLKGTNSELKDLKAEIEEKYRRLTLDVEERVEKISEILERRNQEIRELRDRVNQVKNLPQESRRIVTSYDDSHREMEEKEREIELLRCKLAEATKQMDQKSAQLISLHKEKNSSPREEEVMKLRKELHRSRVHTKRVEKQLRAAEDDAQLRAQDLSTVLSELKMYMLGEFSLSDAVAELKKVRRQVTVRDTQIQDLTQELNMLQINANELLAENSEMREQLDLQPKYSSTSGGNQQDWKNSQHVIDKLRSRVLTLQEEKVAYRAKIYELMRTNSELKNELEESRSTLQPPREIIPVQDKLAPIQKQMEQLLSMVAELVQGRHLSRNLLRSDQSDDLPSQETQTPPKLLNVEETHMTSEITQALVKGQSEPTKSPELVEEKTEESEMYVKNLKKYHRALDSLPRTTQETMVRLKNQVKFLVEEISFKETEVQKGENALTSYRASFESLHKEVLSLNDQLTSERQRQMEEAEALRREVRNLESQSGAALAQVEELKQVLEAATNVDAQTKKVALKCAELKYEVELGRRMTRVYLAEIELLHQRLKENQDNQLAAMVRITELEEKLVHEREQHHVEIKDLRRRIETSIPVSVHDATTTEFAAVTVKYRALLNESTVQMREKIELERAVAEIQSLKEEKDNLSETLVQEKQSHAATQASFAIRVDTNLNEESKVELLMKQLSSAEMQLVVSTQRATHTQRMLETCEAYKKDLANHLKEVEEVNKKLLQENLAWQQREINLQTQVAACSSLWREKLECEVEGIRKDKDQLAIDIQKLNALLRVSETQLRHYKLRCDAAKAEVAQEKSRQRDLAALGDDKLSIALLHLELSREKTRNHELKSESDAARSTVAELSLELDKGRAKMDDMVASLQKTLDYHKQRSVQLLLIIKDLRVQFAGAVPLPHQERLNRVAGELVAERKQLQENLDRAKSDRQEARLMLQEIKAKMENLEDISSTMKTMSSSDRIVSEWSKRLEDVRLTNIRLKEEVFILKEEQQLLKTHLKTKEEISSDLQEQLSRLERLWVEQQRIWEEQQLGVKEEETEPRETLDVNGRIEGMKHHQIQSTLEEYRKENENLKQILAVTQQKLKIKQEEIKQLDDSINYRKTYQPVVLEPSRSIESQLSSTDSADTNPPCLEIILNGLKDRIKISEEALADSKSLVKKYQNDLREKNLQHQKEINHLNDEKYKLETRIKDLQFEMNEIPVRISKSRHSSTKTEIQTLRESLSSLEENLEKSNAEKHNLASNLNRAEFELSICKRQQNEEREEIEMSCEIKVQQMQREIGRLTKQICALQEERDFMKNEVKTIQENAIRSPSLILKVLVEKLRDQLIDKEKQISHLSRSLEEMRDKIIPCEEVEPKSIFIKEEPVRDSDLAFPLPEKLEYAELKDKIIELETANSKLQIRLKELSAVTDNKEEIESLREKYNNIYKQRLKLEKDLSLFKKKNEELRYQLKEFQEKEKDQRKECIKEKEKRRAEIEKSVMEWEVKKKLEMIIKGLKDKMSELEKACSTAQSKLQVSRSLLSKCDKEKLILRDKVTKLQRITAEHMCSVCFRAANVNKDLNRTYTIEYHGKTFHDSKDDLTKIEVENKDEEKYEEKNLDKEWMEEKSHLEKKIAESIQTLKGYRENKDALEKRLAEALEEISALRKNNERLNEHLRKMNDQKKRSTRSSVIMPRTSSDPGSNSSMSGAALILKYEGQIEDLEQQIREKVRLQEHVKNVLEEALAREEQLCADKEILLQKIAILKSVKDDTEESKLIQELRQAKITINQLQREIEASTQPPPTVVAEENS